jgi:hypothetical protein
MDALENRSTAELALEDDKLIDESELERVDTSETSIRIKKIAYAGVLAAVSIAISPIASYLPRHTWGIAFFDPVSLFWIIAFLLGGIEVGLICTVAGTLGLFIFDPTGIGPMFKILATLPMIVVPWLGARFLGKEQGGRFLSNRRKYFMLMILAYFPRLAFMIPLNLMVVPLFFPDIGFLEILTVTIMLNAIQSSFDAFIPFIVIYPTRVYEQFGMW